MKGLLKFLSPFAPDQSGAASVLYEMGGITVICDAGGCTGNICGFDEPRWFEKKSAVFSAGLRDMDAIFGRDDALINKAADAAEKIDAAFIALIGTPVPAVVGTDFRALEKMAEKSCGLPVLALPCTGTRTYEEGEEEAWEKLFRRFAAGKEGGEGKTPAERTFMPEEPAQASAGPAQATAGLVQASVRQAPESGRLGVIGMTPLSVSRTDGDRFLREKFAGGGWKRICCYGMGGTLEEVRQAGKAEKNLVVSPPGIRTAEYLRRTFGTPYETAYPFLTAKEMESLHRLAGKRVLVIHQQIAADEIRKEIRRGFAGISGDGEITAATFFLQSRELMEPQDLHLSSEEDLARAVQGGKYEAVVGDAAFRRVLRDFDGEYVEIPHFAVSGALEKE